MTARLLADALTRSAQAHADRVALRGEGSSLTFGELLMRAQTLARTLSTERLTEHDAVRVMASNHPLDFVALLGVWLAGGVAVPVHRTSPAGVVDAIQAKAQCRFSVDLLIDPAVAACITPLARPEPDAASAAMLRGGALVIFTSGSTGSPKGAVLSHSAFGGKLEQNQRLLQLNPADVTLLVLNNTFSFGIWLALVTLNAGGTVATMSRFDQRRFIDALAGEGITRVGVVPTMVRSVFGSLARDELDAAAARLRGAHCLKDVIIGGEPLGIDLSARLREFIAPAALYDVYGLTETSTSDFVLTPQAYPGHAGSIGTPAAGVRYRIADDRQLECLPGTSGELQLRTPYIMAGYLRDPQLTQAAFSGDWFRTGDLAVSDADGFVSIVGRLKELIVRGGNKLTPLEVERALCACPGVAAALVVGVADPVLGQRIHALLVPAAGGTIDAGAVRAALATRLERFKFPDACYLGAELPTGRTGKIDRGQLQRLLQSGALAALPAWTG